MLPKAVRITEDREFKTVFARGRSYKGDLIVMYVLPRRGRLVRFGFTTVKKIGSAVIRNRVKRLMRESARKLLDDLTRGADIVVLGRTRAAGATFRDVDAELRRLLEASGVMRGSGGQSPRDIKEAER